jgi:hypothetical protein
VAGKGMTPTEFLRQKFATPSKIIEEGKGMTPTEFLRQGSKILDPVLRPYGFQFTEGSSGIGSGGSFACGDYVFENKRLELHFRYTLGFVTYHLNNYSVSHTAYMRALLGESGGNQYPGFSDDPMNGFRHLAHDLQNFAGDFLFGNGVILVKAAVREAAEIEAQEKDCIIGAVGDVRKREDARNLFFEKKYQEVIKKLEGLKYPEQMTESEKKMLEICKRKIP